MSAGAENLHVTIDDDTENVRVDPTTGTIEIDQPDGSVVVELDAHRPKTEGAGSKWFDNLADDIDDMRLGQIANDLYDAIEADNNSRQEYLQIRARGLALLGTELKEPRSSVSDGGAVDGMSTVTNPLLLEIVLKGWANAQAELLPASGPVKIRDDGDAAAPKDELAEAYERDFNHWFTTTAAEYYPDTSHMLLWGTYLGGSGFKKVYRCPLKLRPVSKRIEVQHLIVSNTATDFADCDRITHEITMRPSVMKRMQFIDAYRKVALTQPTPTPNVVDSQVAMMQGTQPNNKRPEDQPYTLWESQCELDLNDFIPKGSKFKGEGIPLPYLVTLDKDSREVLAIRRDWDEADEECQRKRMYVKYPYVPGPGFYGTGAINIVGNSSAAMTAAWRLSLDNAMFANFPSGLIAKMGNRQNSSNVRTGPGEFAPIDTGNLPISSVVMPNPFRDVSSGMLALINLITEQAKQVGGSADIPAGEGLQNIPVGTMLANIEQATKIIAAAHKGMHTAQSLELELLIDLFRAHPEDFWRTNKVCPKEFWNEQRLLGALEDCNLVPVSDPNVPSHLHRIAKALALIQLKVQFPGKLDEDEVLKRCLVAIREDPRGLILPPNPAAGMPQVEPDKMITAQAKMKDAETKAGKTQIEAVTSQQDNATKLAEVKGRERIAELNLQRDLVIHANDAARAHAQEVRAGQEQAHSQAKDAFDMHHTADEHQHTKALNVAELALEHRKLDEAPKPPKTPAKSKK